MKRGVLALLFALLLPVCAAAEGEGPVRLTTELPCIEEALRSEPLCLDTGALIEQHQWLDAASAIRPACETLEDEQTGKLCLRLTGGIDYAYFPEATVKATGIDFDMISFTYDAERDLFVCDEGTSDEALAKLAQALREKADDAYVGLRYTGALDSNAVSGAISRCYFDIDPYEGGVQTQMTLRYIDGEKKTHIYDWHLSRRMLDYSNPTSSLQMRFSNGELSSYQLTFDGMDGDVIYDVCYDAYGEVYAPDHEGYEDALSEPMANVLCDVDGKKSFFSYKRDFEEQIWKHFDRDERVWRPASEGDPAGGALISPYDERLASPYGSLYPDRTPPPPLTPSPAPTPVEPGENGKRRFVFGS